MEKRPGSRKTREIILFIILGAIAVLSGYGTMWFCIESLNIPYTVSSFIGTIVNLLVSFYLQRKYTFDNKDGSNLKKQLAPYLLMRTTIIIVTPPSMYLLVEKCKASYTIAFIILTIIFSVVSYIFSKKILSPKNS
ncbi:MAG: GtrA family protein [Candidatus Pacebacteria bacterium]|nr:GtrA family protein [Candidatus Paceibacterota bacterium]